MAVGWFVLPWVLGGHGRVMVVTWVGMESAGSYLGGCGGVVVVT